VIIGAGLSGLIAAHAWPQFPVREVMPKPTAAHKAVLRFRGTEVADLLGIEFRPVTVRKGIWHDGREVAPTLALANLYARKVVGRVVDRSIWNLDTVRRYIAPETLYEQLVESVGDRIEWGAKERFIYSADPPSSRGPRLTISTVPLPATLQQADPNDALGVLLGETPFARAPIYVQRFRIPGADVHQTLYFPAPDLDVYRASITGDLLIIEQTAPQAAAIELGHVLVAFGLAGCEVEMMDSVEQKYGKIVPIPDAIRRATLARLTEEFGIYSLGRFATWRNILLDDLPHDISVIKRLMKTDRYTRRLHP
jgi:hypothetical protein